MPPTLRERMEKASIAISHCEVDGHDLLRLCVNTDDGLYYADMDGWNALALAEDISRIGRSAAQHEAERSSDEGVETARSSLYILEQVTLTMFQLTQAATKQSGLKPNDISLGLIAQAYRAIKAMPPDDRQAALIIKAVLEQCKKADIEASETDKI